MKVWQKTALKYLLELVIVAFGVVLGFIITDWKNNRETATKIKESMALIKEELTSNRKRLEKAITYHTSLDSSLAVFIKDKPESFLEEYIFRKSGGFGQVPGWQGTGNIPIEDFAIQSARQANLMSQYPLPLLQSINGCYNALENYQNMGDRIFSKLFEINMDTKNKDILFILELLKGDLRNQEMRLLQVIDSTLEDLP